jgi:hypothetical protein
VIVRAYHQLADHYVQRILMLKPGSHFGCAMFLTVRQREEDAQRTPIAITPLSADGPCGPREF